MNVVNKETKYGYISEINGSLIKVKGLENQIRIHDLIKVSNYNILGEVIQKYSDHVIIQCFENTQNLKIKEKVINLQEPLSMELAPGLITNVFDGIQRPLKLVFENFKEGSLERGIDFPSLSRKKKWRFFPLKKFAIDSRLESIMFWSIRRAGVSISSSYIMKSLILSPSSSTLPDGRSTLLSPYIESSGLEMKSSRPPIRSTILATLSNEISI